MYSEVGNVMILLQGLSELTLNNENILSTKIRDIGIFI